MCRVGCDETEVMEILLDCTGREGERDTKATSVLVLLTVFIIHRKDAVGGHAIKGLVDWGFCAVDGALVVAEGVAVAAAASK